MFDYLWMTGKTNSKADLKELVENKYTFAPTVWSEHCIECSAPDCYASCKIYQKRRDGDCVRISNGISPIAIRNGRVYEGAKLQFRRWAKIESPVFPIALTEKEYSKLVRRISYLVRVVNQISTLFPEKVVGFCVDGAYSLRLRYLNHVVRKNNFVNELCLIGKAKAEKKSIFIIEIKSEGTAFFRDKIELGTEYQIFSIAIPATDQMKRAYISLYPELVDDECTAEFEYLELIGTEEHKEKKVKCVIWDLDNTLWNGTLIESNDVILRQDIMQIIKALDEKGIVNSICSKNNESDAVKKLEELGIADYFVFKEINWEPKSKNVSRIVKNMNISADTVVFVDDTQFEREEVKSVNPDIAVVDVRDVVRYIQGERFDVPVTQDSKKRRDTYRMLEKQVHDRDSFEGNIDEFLISCQMKMKIAKPTREELMRCFELLQRTNQLNASGRRLSFEEVEQIYDSEEYSTYALTCEDKYGKYGLVGFVIVQNGKVPVVTDFVISCRVANKKIEHAVLKYIAGRSINNDLKLVFKKTNRNGPIAKVISDLGMKTTDEELFYWNGKTDLDLNRIVEIN